MVNKARLGRGLGALIPDLDIEKDQPAKRDASSIEQIKIARIQPNPFQPRQEFDPVALGELKQSISEKGLIQPITVRRINNFYQIIAGERRFRAVSDLKFATIPAYILDVKTDEDMLELSLIENIQREDLNPIEVAAGFQRLMTECRLTQEEVAQKVGKERSTVTNFLRLLKLPQLIRDSLIQRELSMGHARALVSIDRTELQLQLWQKIIKDDLSVRKVEAMVKNEGKPRPKKKKEDDEIPVFIMDAENRLRRALATQVRIMTKGDTGKIEIEFYSRDELEGLLSKFDQL